MAPTSHGRTAHNPWDSYAGGSMDDNVPPPSTLAAQLVENISTSATSSRPDETAELNKFFGIIENVKNQPDILDSPQSRVDHNHMLIYVYARVVLQGPQWNDPSREKGQLCADALKAISFFKLTIKETPEVLLATSEPGDFLFRGGEPLWIWMFPKVLSTLTHEHSDELYKAVESLFHTMFLTTCQTGSMWSLTSQMLEYLRLNFDDTMNHLKSTRSSSTTKNAALQLRIPSDSYLGTVVGDNVPPLTQQCTYTLSSTSQALHHASCLLSSLSIPLVLSQPAFDIIPIFHEHVPWLLDASLGLHETHIRWSSITSSYLPGLIQNNLQILAALRIASGFGTLINQKAYTLLVLLCTEASRTSQSTFSDKEAAVDDGLFCLSLIKIAEACLVFKPIARLVSTQLNLTLQGLLVNGGVAVVTADLRRCTEILRRVTVDPVPDSLAAILQSDHFANEELRQQVKALSIKSTETIVAEQLAKRRKVGGSQALPMITDHLWRLLGFEPRASLTNFEGSLQANFAQLTESTRCRVIELLGHVGCAADDTLSGRNGHEGGFSCSYCQSYRIRLEPSQCIDVAARKSLLKTFSTLLLLPGFQESRRPRIAAMVSLRRIARHCNDLDLIDIDISVAAQWCLKSLKSSVRELRIAAGRTLAAFLIDFSHPGAGTNVVRRNRDNALKRLHSISEQCEPRNVESCILAWAHIARVVADDQLKLVLVKLMEYLGHESIIISAAAMTEIIKLAEFRFMSPRQLFAPFWRYLAFSAVKDLDTRPKLTRQLAELLDMKLDDLLLYVQEHALPFLVLTKKREVIQKLAEARKENGPWEPCLDSNNIGRILAVLLTQDIPNIQEHSMSLLRHISSHFDDFRLTELLQIEPMMTALELLKAAADADEDRKPRVRAALGQMAVMVIAASGEPRVKKAQAVGRFLQQWALGMMAVLADVFNESSPVPVSLQQQKDAIKTMEELIRAGRHYIRIARPQISACVLAAMSNDELRSVSFSCWAAMLLHLEVEDIEVLIETTFFLINHYWMTLDSPTQNVCRELLEHLLGKEREILEKFINKLPSLSHVNELSDIESRLSQLRSNHIVDSRTAFVLLAERICHENGGVVLQALRELVSYLQNQQGYLQTSAVSEQPDSVVPSLVRALLECSSKYNGIYGEISDLCTQCIGLVGCLDPNRVETVRDEKQQLLIVRSNFADSTETTDFVIFLLENILVKSFLSQTDTRYQGFLAYAMQKLLANCDITLAIQADGVREAGPIYRKWLSMSEIAREVLTPFLSSSYTIAPMVVQPVKYPIFRADRPIRYALWTKSLLLDCLRRPQGGFAALIFEPLCRLISFKDLSIAEFLFPHVIHHLIIGEESSEAERMDVIRELHAVLEHELPSDATYSEKEDKKLFCETVFRFLDYTMRWFQGKKVQSNTNPRDAAAIAKVQSLLESFSPEMLSQRAAECQAYSRALLYLETYIREVDEQKSGIEDRDRLLHKLQDIYTQVDEPDGLEGISSQLHVLDINQQVLSHRKAGRWAAAQTWYEIKLAEDPDNVDVQIDLLTCLKESGQHDVLLNYVEGIEKHTGITTINRIVPYAVEASWTTGKWDIMQKFLSKYQGDYSEDFNVSIAQALLYLKRSSLQGFLKEIRIMRNRIGSSMTFSATSSILSCHEPMLRAHVLTDLELIVGVNSDVNPHPHEILQSLTRRLEILGSYVNDKQYVLSVRRAAMELVSDTDISALWLSSARLARKTNSMHQSFNAVLHASQLGDHAATIENARLLWKEGHNRKAIQTLQGAVTSNVFANRSFMEGESFEKNAESPQNLLTARAQLLLAKWLDSAGQTHATALREYYKEVPKNFATWEKGHYYLGRHYKKLLESEKTLKPDDQSDEYLTGETAKLVIENYVRSLNFGTKYLYQTLPRVLTLWLELGAQIGKAPEGKVSISRELFNRRKIQLDSLHEYLSDKVGKMPAYIFYTTLPQLVARIAHPNADVFRILEEIIMRVVEAYPRQAIWSLFAIMTSKQTTSERRARGQQMLLKLKGKSKKGDGRSYDLKTFLRMGEKLADQLLMACNNGDFQSNRTTHASITRDLNFNHKCTPCPLVVPIETCLTVTLPTLTDSMRRHKAFSRDVVLIDSFLDDVLVLGSLAKPRKLTARGSNGVNYGLLIKPKDDLRTDQRLMEFNSMINRSLKRDAESSRRQLYIKTYAVTPLNEECGIIEWVDGLKTLRDILLNIYRSRGIAPNYTNLQAMMKDAASNDKNTKIFTEQVLGMFPPVLPSWFVAQFPGPSAWFAARLRYTRSCAVMSMVGTILGLGDRHGENVLLEEGNGGVFHVDFNCLFDKGLTFAQPERVPFRLTHNMVAAMGIYGYEGPFRTCSELTLRILRQQEETLMTILEAFIYDPTLDLQKDKRRKNEPVRLNPQSVVDSIKRKVKGLLPDESIPLGVEGQAEELIKQAVSPKNLTAMYIGWCPFL